MANRELKHKPLVEAILEVRWALTKSDQGPGTDPHYRLLLGRLYDRVLAEFPIHEPLPASALPDDMLGQIVQHRFRTSANGWPLVQIGPGIASLNATDDYSWQTFRPKAMSLVDRLFEAHPKVADLRIEALVLRYVDAVVVHPDQESVLEFLKDKLKIGIDLPSVLFDKTAIDPKPLHLSWSSTFRAADPAGAIDLRFSMGKKADEPALIWESTFRSLGGDLPALPGGFANWVDGAHKVVNDWFFKLIEGDLRRRFSGDANA